MINRKKAGLNKITNTIIYVIAGTFTALTLALSCTFYLIGVPAKSEKSTVFLNKFCLLTKNTLDKHLPCLTASGTLDERSFDREALWSVIGTLCKPVSYIGINYPCLKADPWRGYAVLRSPREQLDFLITPTIKITGVESLELLEKNIPNYWAFGWEQRVRLDEVSKKKLSWNDYLLVINSKETRSQDQLHIHLSCVDKNLKKYFSSHSISKNSNWQAIHLPYVEADFFMKILQKEEINQNIFKLIYDEVPGAKIFAEKQTVALVGLAQSQWRGFVLLVSLAPVTAEAFFASDC